MYVIVFLQLDSSAFFPYLSYGANNEMAGIVTLLAVAEALGDLKRNVSRSYTCLSLTYFFQGDLINTTNAIMFVFFQGVSSLQ